jgi:ferredoxin-like protein FixX|uniref:Zinc binding domain n=1 Tax=Siphoviridae sp. ctP6113 TaxID=2826318 RepID=A0A8S5MU35_9CAUD|nr:MAG TPA: Putative zinc binding domain [Siphoviridae sp. ctP6113]
MELENLMQALNGLKVETSSLACLECGHLRLIGFVVNI